MEQEQKQEVPQKYNWERNVVLSIFFSVCVGVFSGMVNTFFDLMVGVPQGGMFDFSDSFMESLWPGFVFGIITLPWFFFLFYRNMTRMKMIIVPVFWLASSVFSYYAAIYALHHINNTGTYDLPFAGFVGAFIVAIAFHSLFQKMNVFNFISICVVGAVVSGAVLLPYVLYPLWQGVIVWGLVSSSIRKSPPNKVSK